MILEEDWFLLMVDELGIPFVNLERYQISPDIKDFVSEQIARQYKIIPLADMQFSMTIAVSDPLNVFMIDDLKQIIGKDIDLMLSTETDILKKIDSFYSSPQSQSSKVDLSQDIQMDDFEIVMDKDMQEEDEGSLDESEKAPIIRMVNLVLKEALKQRASDIHIEPKETDVRVRYRIDGVLQDILIIPKSNQNAVLTRIKIMSRIDITVNQAPQDGRFKLTLPSKEVDFRVSLLPTTFGQKVVMRILDKGSLSIGLEGLGFAEESLKILEDGITKPFGMLLVTGPTGSGKSTTLYSLINELNTPEKNVITVEDPVEFLINGLTQIQAHPEIGLTFASGLRAILRQSPDVVMIGEIRDGETADIAIKASLTGQLVLSTLHTNDAAGALTRLVDMGVEPFLVASSLVIVTAQRLCRKICASCKVEAEVNPKYLKRLDAHIVKNTVFYEGKGCAKCKDTGYLGRTCVTEVLNIDDDIRELLLQGKSSDEIKEFACENKGMITLWKDAMNKCLQGKITLEEVFRVTSEE